MIDIIAFSYKPEMDIKEMAFILSGFPSSSVNCIIPSAIVTAIYSMCESIERGFLPAKGYNLNSNGDWTKVEGTVMIADVAAWASTRGMQWPPIIRKPNTNLFNLTSTHPHPAVITWAQARGVNWPRKKRMPKAFSAKSPQNITQAKEQTADQQLSEPTEQIITVKNPMTTNNDNLATLKLRFRDNRILELQKNYTRLTQEKEQLEVKYAELTRQLQQAQEENVRPKIPDYMNPSHPRYSKKLAATIDAWVSFEHYSGGGTPKQGLKILLEEKANQYGLTGKGGEVIALAIEECSKVANWSGGGPGKPRRLDSQHGDM
ncbi:hypothetical protein [Aeromonas bestiarum]|uniref:hypothetical protein n=1 Tax=Aeromonas bestiarum TaxID=105751 RepID=UPI0011AF3C8A|nr:hypothetical protein [Aeromonas bestiarum]